MAVINPKLGATLTRAASDITKAVAKYGVDDGTQVANLLAKSSRGIGRAAKMYPAYDGMHIAQLLDMKVGVAGLAGAIRGHASFSFSPVPTLEAFANQLRTLAAMTKPF